MSEKQTTATGELVNCRMDEFLLDGGFEDLLPQGVKRGRTALQAGYDVGSKDASQPWPLDLPISILAMSAVSPGVFFFL